MYNCKKQNKKLPWEHKKFIPGENVIKSIIKYHENFWNENTKNIKENSLKKIILNIKNNPKKH